MVQIRIKTIASLLLASIIFLDLNCSGLISPELYEGLCNDLNRTGQVILVFLLFIVLGGNIRKKFFWTYIVGYIFAISFICGAFSISEYNQSVYDIYVMLNCYILLLLIPLLESKVDFISVVKLVIIIVSITMAIDILQSIVYSINSTVFIKNLTSESLKFRNDMLRHSNAGMYPPIIALIILGKEKNVSEQLKLIHRIIIVGMSAIIMVFCGQTRSVMFAFISAAIVTLLLRRERIDAKCITIITIVIVCGIALQNPQIQFMLDTLTNSSTVEFNTIGVRGENILYRLGFFDKNMFFGMGIIRGLGELKAIALGPSGLFYSSDVGIIDTIASFGLFGVLLILFIYCHWFNIIRGLIRNRLIGQYSWYVGIVVFYLINGLTIGYFAPSTIVCFSITNAMMVAFCEKEIDYKKSRV